MPSDPYTIIGFYDNILWKTILSQLALTALVSSICKQSCVTSYRSKTKKIHNLSGFEYYYNRQTISVHAGLQSSSYILKFRCRSEIVYGVGKKTCQFYVTDKRVQLTNDNNLVITSGFLIKVTGSKGAPALPAP